MSISYADSGVNIDAGHELVQRIKTAVAGTFRPGVCENIGGFGGLFDPAACGLSDPLLVAGTDGVGTKLLLAAEAGRVEGLGTDLVAMCVNDIATRGAEPWFFLDYFATGKLDPAFGALIVTGIAQACAQVGCALLGGETAELPGLYAPGHFDLAGFCVGALERSQLRPQPAAMRAGDGLVGVASSGPHANGYSLIRAVLQRDGISGAALLPWLTPTRLYVDACRTAFSLASTSGAAHITGGGLVENVPRILPAHLKADLHALPALPEWCVYLQRAAELELHELQRTFNCGVGMVFVSSDPETLTAALNAAGERASLIGHLVPA